MNSFTIDFRKVYQLQDKFLLFWKTLDLPMFLTGGTALGRFYFGHRYSEDLDFFCNANPDYQRHINFLNKEIPRHFSVNIEQSLFTGDFTRFFISEDNQFLKIELVNDVDYYYGEPIKYFYGLIDNPANILANKLTAIISRDEPKDVFDILHISLNCSFSWTEVFYLAKQKAVINEIDIARRLYEFPAEWLEHVQWVILPFKLFAVGESIRRIADDFLFGRENSLGAHKIPIDKARPGLTIFK